jgi:hypothetical protein
VISYLDLNESIDALFFFEREILLNVPKGSKPELSWETTYINSLFCILRNCPVEKDTKHIRFRFDVRGHF